MNAKPILAMKDPMQPQPAELAKNVTVVILAGGLGTRIKHLHPETPKPMIAGLGRPFLYWLTAYFSHFGLSRFIYSTGYRGDKIALWCQDDSLPGLERIARQEPEPWGTGGGLLNCLDLCDAWVLVANGDSLCIGGIEALLAQTHNGTVDGALLAVHRDDTARYGSLGIDDNGLLSSFDEKVAGAGYVNGGTYLFRVSALRQFPQRRVLSIENDMFPRLLSQDARIGVIPLRDAPFIDIGTPDSLAAVDAFLLTHKAYFAKR